MIRLIVGLGNPGLEYEKTRHNAGFIFLDHLAGFAGAKWSSSAQFQGEMSRCVLGGHELILFKPMAYMNKSGQCAGKLLRYYKLKPEELLVAHDEIELAEGVVRMKRDGGHAGHNGLRDIIANIGSRDFYRLRIGVGRPASGGNVADYVLSAPSKDVQVLLGSACQSLIVKLDLLIGGDVESVNKLSSA